MSMDLEAMLEQDQGPPVGAGRHRLGGARGRDDRATSSGPSSRRSWPTCAGSRTSAPAGSRRWRRRPTNPTLAEIYRYFHAEEQRHANAELALMKRWGMLDGRRDPRAQCQHPPGDRVARHATSDDMPLSVLGTVIPMLEVALDGALLKFLLEEVHDPVCHQVFEKINNDESRHIAVDFEVLDMIGHAHARKLADRVRRPTSPRRDWSSGR